jgi:hypothetical protein
MASFQHEFLVDLFRNSSQLVIELLRSCAGIDIDHARIDAGSLDLSQVAPVGYFADHVVVLRDLADRPVAGVIVEIQRIIKSDKRRTWPAYVANLRAQLECSALLLVVALDPSIAAWASQTIELGHPGFRLTPIVIGADAVPEVRDEGTACRLPELAMLSVMAHPELEIAQAAISALGVLPEDRARLYLDVIMMMLPVAIRQTLEVQMQRYEYQSDFARKYYGQGRQEGHQAGLQAAVLSLARSKLGNLSEEDVTAIEAIHDLRALTELVTSLGHAVDVAEARAALDHAFGS